MFPRRGIIALVTTALALVLLFTFKTPATPVVGSTDVPACHEFTECRERWYMTDRADRATRTGSLYRHFDGVAYTVDRRRGIHR